MQRCVAEYKWALWRMFCRRVWTDGLSGVFVEWCCDGKRSFAGGRVGISGVMEWWRVVYIG